MQWLEPNQRRDAESALMPNGYLGGASSLTLLLGEQISLSLLICSPPSTSALSKRARTDVFGSDAGAGAITDATAGARGITDAFFS